MTIQDKAQSEQVEVALVLSESQRQAFQAMAVTHGMSGDIRVIKAEVTDFVVGDTA